MEISWHNKVNGTRVYHLHLQTKEEHEFKTEQIKSSISNYMRKHNYLWRDYLKVRKLYLKPHYMAKTLNDKQHLFVVYKQFPIKHI